MAAIPCWVFCIMYFDRRMHLNSDCFPHCQVANSGWHAIGRDIYTSFIPLLLSFSVSTFRHLRPIRNASTTSSYSTLYIVSTSRCSLWRITMILRALAPLLIRPVSIPIVTVALATPTTLILLLLRQRISVFYIIWFDALYPVAILVSLLSTVTVKDVTLSLITMALALLTYACSTRRRLASWLSIKWPGLWLYLLVLLISPEETLVSPNLRPISLWCSRRLCSSVSRFGSSRARRCDISSRCTWRR